jgi:hypothetical protein
MGIGLHKFLSESLFYSTKLLNMAIVRNIEVMSGQILSHSVQNSFAQSRILVKYIPVCRSVSPPLILLNQAV